MLLVTPVLCDKSKSLLGNGMLGQATALASLFRPGGCRLVLPNPMSSSDYPAASEISSSTLKPSAHVYSNLPLDLSAHTHNKFTADTQFIGQMSLNNSSTMLSAGLVISM